MQLRPFEGRDLPLVRPCFEDAEERLCLGGPAWPARTAIRVAATELRDLRLFALGIEADNLASSRCALAAGLLPDPAEPDWEGIVHHLLRR